MLQTRSIIPVGPMCSLREAEGHETMEVASDDENPCLQWLNTQSPGSVLYVAFGSGRTGPLATAQLQHLAEGLEASGQPFLWVLNTPGATMESTLPAMSDLLPPGEPLFAFSLPVCVEAIDLSLSQKRSSDCL